MGNRARKMEDFLLKIHCTQNALTSIKNIMCLPIFAHVQWGKGLCKFCQSFSAFPHSNFSYRLHARLTILNIFLPLTTDESLPVSAILLRRLDENSALASSRSPSILTVTSGSETKEIYYFLGCIVTLRALNREVEQYGFFLIKALRKYHHAMGWGLLPIAPCFWHQKVSNFFFLLSRILLMIWIFF